MVRISGHSPALFRLLPVAEFFLVLKHVLGGDLVQVTPQNCVHEVGLSHVLSGLNDHVYSAVLQNLDEFFLDPVDLAHWLDTRSFHGDPVILSPVALLHVTAYKCR